MLQIDRFRLEELGEKLLQLIICTSCVLITCNLAGREVSERNAFKTDLKNQLLIITNCIERRYGKFFIFLNICIYFLILYFCFFLMEMMKVCDKKGIVGCI